jgi:protein deglycase
MNVLTPWADGLEEMEAVILVDLFRRAGWTVVAAGLNGMEPVHGSRKVRLLPDAAWDAVDPMAFDLLALPGGGRGAETLAQHAGVQEAIRWFDRAARPLAAVCAAPLALAAAGILRGRRATCYPDLAPRLRAVGADYVDQPVVHDGHLVTSQGPGTCFAFALALIAKHEGERRAGALATAGLIAR